MTYRMTLPTRDVCDVYLCLANVFASVWQSRRFPRARVAARQRSAHSRPPNGRARGRELSGIIFVRKSFGSRRAATGYQSDDNEDGI